MTVKDIIQNNTIWKPSFGEIKEAPLVSVLLPTFRRAQSGLFEQAVRSVCSQTLKNWELIIVDDASTDGTEEIIDLLMKSDARISCIRHINNIGLPAISEYEAYKVARGKYIAFLFDDVEWEKDALEKTISYMEENQCVASYGIARLRIDDTGEYDEIGKPGQFSNEELILTNAIANFTVVLKRDVIEDIGLYDPHLSLVRNCDWDLWTRVSKKYEIMATGIIFGTEKGYTLSDSLGNSYRLNRWVCTEHFQHDRNDLLKPDVFENYDVLETFGVRSWMYISEMKAILNQYSNKFWYSLISFNPETDRNHRHILVLVNDVDASLLSFERLKSDQLTFRYAKYMGRDFLPNDICLADAVIIHRNIYKWKEHWPMLLSAGVPLYYYIDDNFSVLAQSGVEDAALLSSCITQETLSIFQGVFLSTQALKDYFADHKLHSNLYVFPPVVLQPTHIDKIKNKGRINIAFMGGGFRYPVLKSCILPALKKLAKKVEIALYLPEDAKEIIGKKSDFGFNISYIKRTKILDRAIHSYAEQGIDIQIHCGETLPNNQYKTLNALCNSVMLGAALITSEQSPFVEHEELIDKAYMMAKNIEEDWYNKLLYLAKNSDMRLKMLCNALEFCEKEYSQTVAEQQFLHGLSGLHEKDICVVLDRYEKFGLFMYRQCEQQNQNRLLGKTFRIVGKIRTYWKHYSFGTIIIVTKKVMHKYFRKSI